MEAIQTRIGLNTTDSFTEWIAVRLHHRLALDVILGSTFSYGSAVLSLQWTNAIGEDLDGDTIEQANGFPVAVVLNSTTTSLRRVGIGGLAWIRLKCTTANGASDPKAIVRMALT